MFDFLHVLQFVIHYSFHLLLPGFVAWIFFRKKWKVAWFIMILTMLVDLDHLLTNPVFDPNRCSIGFHPLHSFLAIFIYFLLLFAPNGYIRIISAGLLLHMLTDLQDCFWINFLG